MLKHHRLELTQTPVLKCLRCGSTDTRVIREIPGTGDVRYVDAQCVTCREQFVLQYPASRAANACATEL